MSCKRANQREEIQQHTRYIPRTGPYWTRTAKKIIITVPGAKILFTATAECKTAYRNLSRCFFFFYYYWFRIEKHRLEKIFQTKHGLLSITINWFLHFARGPVPFNQNWYFARRYCYKYFSLFVQNIPTKPFSHWPENASTSKQTTKKKTPLKTYKVLLTRTHKAIKPCDGIDLGISTKCPRSAITIIYIDHTDKPIYCYLLYWFRINWKCYRRFVGS